LELSLLSFCGRRCSSSSSFHIRCCCHAERAGGACRVQQFPCSVGVFYIQVIYRHIVWWQRCPSSRGRARGGGG
jgi:hypothetical protein